MAGKTKVIASGDISPEALTFFQQHGCKVEDTLGLSLVTLPETALVEKGSQSWEYTVTWYDQDGNYEEVYAVVELDIDAYETRVYTKKS